MRHIYKFIPVALLAIFLISRCDTDELHDMNINPNALNQMDVNYFFTRAELGLTSGGDRGDNRYLDWRTNIGMCAHAMQQLATASTGLLSTGDKYLDNDPEVSAAPFEFWGGRGCPKWCAEVLRQTGAGGFQEGLRQNTMNATRIVKALNFGRLTDMYGSVPYFEADKAQEGIFYPVYDKQKDIYTDILKELDEASTALSASLPDDGFAEADLIYDGDIAKWKKLGHTLMLRFGLRVYEADNSMGLQYINKAIAGGVFTSTDDDVFIGQAVGPAQWTNQNGISRAMIPGDGGQGRSSLMSKTMIDFLMGADKASTADDDPRLMIYSGGIGEWTSVGFALVAGGDDPLNQLGLPNGKTQSLLDQEAGHSVVITSTYSTMNPKLLDFDDPYRLVTYAESELLLAECLERGIGTGITGTAQSHYENGVKAAMQTWDKFDPSFVVTDAQVTAYLAAHPYGVEQPALDMIGWQIWANHFCNWFEAWSEWRRTGRPALVPTNYTGNDTNGTIPVRLRYPSHEVSNNPNYQTGATMPDKITTKTWVQGGAE
jgi:hypothetical protein